MFSYMLVHCPICRGEFDGMRGYGRADKCCCKQCYDEWEWRKTLAIMGKPYQPRKDTTNGHGQAEDATGH